MRLGARWQTGETPHRSVPLTLFPLITESELLFPSASSWTITWLENLPRCSLESYITIGLAADGIPWRKILTEGDPAHLLDSQQHHMNSQTVTGNSNQLLLGSFFADDDDDDEWLSH